MRQGDFTTTIRAIEGTKSAQDFSAYNTPFGASANTGLERSNKSTVFLYRDTTRNEFSLFMIHDKPQDEGGGNIRLTIAGLNNASKVAAFDDTSDGPPQVPADSATVEWNWSPCCTDGTAITFTNRNICVAVNPEKVNGVNAWSIVGGPNINGNTRTQLPSLKDEFTICLNNQPPTADPGPPQTVECTGNGGAQVTLDGSGSSDPNGDPLTYSWLIDETLSRTGAVVTEHLQVGDHTASLTVNDGLLQDTAHTTVTVQDTTPPVVSVSDPSEEWPPNHTYRTFSLADCGITIEDACQGPLDLISAKAAITCVSSDEPINDTGDGNTSPDIEFVDATTVNLRAERQGSNDGRVYKIHFQVQDAAGNPATGECIVGTPHDQSGPTAGDSGESYRVCRP
ncbi:MAG TPA: PKD domain-containing protein [Myxococcaceae bacterium]|nr:PKD domain-containing protein [Myxococcaceae bacterium]